MTGRYSKPSDYLREIIRRDQERAERIARLQGLVDEGLESGTGAYPWARSAPKPVAGRPWMSGYRLGHRATAPAVSPRFWR